MQTSTSFTVQNGVITRANLTVDGKDIFKSEPGESNKFPGLLGRDLHKIGDWAEVLPEPMAQANFGISKWLNNLFGKSS
jgi:hypothetical protein